jgi:hypothetical protein
MIVDALKTPMLYIQQGDVSASPPGHHLGTFRIIHVKVRNKKNRLRWLPIKVLTAFSTQAKITMHGKTYVAKWASAPEPMTNNIPQINQALLPSKADIYPSNGYDDEFDQFAVGIKYDKEDEFYAFDNGSYLHNLHKNPALSFGLGTFEASVILSTLGDKTSYKVRVFNPTNTLDDFSLEII